MTYIRTFHAGLPACLTDQALSACGGDPFLARTSTCSCTPDFCQRNLHLARIRRFSILHSAAGRRQSENSVALPIVRLVHSALPSGLIAALRLHCTLQTGSSASFASRSSLHPIRSAHTNSSPPAVPVRQFHVHGEELEW